MTVAIALVAAMLLGVGFVLQQRAAGEAPKALFLRFALIAELLKQRRWLAGLAIMVTRAPSLVRASLRCSLLGLGGSRGDGLLWSPGNGLHDTTTPGFSGDTDWQQGDAPQSAG